MTSNKKKVLLFADWYYPGYKAGGPIQSCSNLAFYLADHYKWSVITSNRDLGDIVAYEGIPSNEWISGKYGERILYCDYDTINLRSIRQRLRAEQPDIVYINSMFSYHFALLPLLALKIFDYKGKIVLAPRGMLHKGALEFKSIKKRLFLNFLRLTGISRKIHFHATDEQEKKDILSFFPGASVSIAENIPHVRRSHPEPIDKTPGIIRLVFLSRIHPKKNLHYLLKILNKFKLDGLVDIDIYGEESDGNYLASCKNLSATLPDNIRVTFNGGLMHDNVFMTLENYHAFIMPTLGENFGHAIFESLSSGRPVVISDQTPWRNLQEKKVGWDIPLDRPELFAEAIQQLIFMDQKEWNVFSINARQASLDYISAAEYEKKYSLLYA